MTSQLLIIELTSLAQDTKRRHPEIRVAADKSLHEIKNLPNTSEAQLAADLRRKADFIFPFLLACKAGSPKHAALAVVSIQRLVVIRAIAAERLEDVLDALRACSELGADVQLRVLQIMPFLFQRYGDQITEHRLTAALQISFLLQSSGNAVISNTATATLQQVINDVFSRLGMEQTKSDAPSPDTSRLSWQAELDCHQILRDLCLVAEGKQVRLFDKVIVSRDLAFELVGSILLNFTAIIPRFTNFIDILRQHLLPLMLRVLSSAASFNSTVRALRIIPPIIKGFLDILPTESEMLLSMLTHMLEPEAAPDWKRTMCMEVIRELYKEASNIRRAYAIFDQREDHKAIIGHQLEAISRLSSEKPIIIGLGHRSSLPATLEQDSEDLDGLSALHADPSTATTGVSLTTITSTESGIGVNISSVKVSLIDQLDKLEPPMLPPSYMYSICLTSLNLLSEGLARYILPFAASRNAAIKGQRSSEYDNGSSNEVDSDDDQLPANPLHLHNHPEYEHIDAIARLIDRNWSSLLSVYSTFFQAALDAEYYHGAIRAFQKLIQVATLLRLSAPRDAFLSTLSRQSLPIDSNRSNPLGSVESQVDSLPSVVSTQRLSPRNLLCLRALLNLGVALGTALDSSWPIILNTLQQADIIIGYVTTDRTLSKGGPAIIAPAAAAGDDVSRDFINEVSAVRSAALRMLNSTTAFPKGRFLAFIDHLANQFRGPGKKSRNSTKSVYSGHPLESPQPTERHGTSQGLRANVWVIDAFAQTISFNGTRFARLDPKLSGWSHIVEKLMIIVADTGIDAEIRVAAAESICESIKSATFSDSEPGMSSILTAYAFSALRELASQTKEVKQHKSGGGSGNAAEDVQNIALQTLKSCLDHYGEAIEGGWQDICKLILTAFEIDDATTESAQVELRSARPLSTRLLKSAFASLQTICSEAIDSLPAGCMPDILRAVYFCCVQTAELNISLTAMTLYAVISDFMWSTEEKFGLSASVKNSARDGQSAFQRLWMQLLFALCEISTSSQSEVRNSAVHACFRVITSIADQLQPEAWDVCVETVFVRLYQSNQSMRSRLSIDDVARTGTSLDETAASIHHSVCALLEEFPSQIFTGKKMPSLWTQLISQMSNLLSRSSLALSKGIFGGLSKVLDSLLDSGVPFTDYSATTWELWANNNPHSHRRVDRPDNSDNQATLSAYISCAISLHRVSSELQRFNVMEKVLVQVRLSVFNSTRTPYVNDLMNMTDLQLESERLLTEAFDRTDNRATNKFLQFLGPLIELPHKPSRPDDAAKGPTFVAFNAAILTLFGRCVRERARGCSLHEQQATTRCLESIDILLSRKAFWQKEDQIVTPWRHATTVVMEAAEILLRLSRLDHYPEASFRTWKAILNVMDSILAFGMQQTQEPDILSSDLAFDISAFEIMFNMLVPSLGTEQLPEEARQRFARTLMMRSLIHEPHPDDSLDPSVEWQWPQPDRIGRVRDLPPSKRARLCYILLERMFLLVRSEPISKENALLASAIAPYLRLRSELVLKAYISDQPLRGLMPCPVSEERELRCIVQEGIRLAFPKDVDAAEGPSRLKSAHVTGLKKLAVAAIRVTRHDEKMRTVFLDLVEA